MAWREVSNNAIDIKTKPGAEYIGTYRGSRTFDSQYGEQFVYRFDSFSCYGFTSLNRAMEGIPLGAKIRIVYKGKEIIETKRGSVPMHMCQVFIDDSTIPSDTPAPFDPDEIPV